MAGPHNVHIFTFLGRTNTTLRIINHDQMAGKKGHHSAHIPVPQGYTGGETLRLSDRYPFWSGESRSLYAKVPINANTFEDLRMLRVPHPRDSPGLSPMPPPSAPRSRRDSDTEPELVVRC